MVNGILKISQLESGKMPLRRTAFDMTVLIDQVLDAQTPLALEKDISLRHAVNGMPLEPHPIRPVFADPELIERVLQNLVSNALKFTPSGGEISVRATADASRQMLIVEVKDTGPGISADIREQLFEKFVTGLHAEKGSGLGLAFCRMAVEEHGGKIWVESDSGEGATFYFTLPFVTVEGTG
jgi:signal transduction histidine kinase